MSDDGNRYVGQGTDTINEKNFRYTYNASCLCGGWNSEGSVIGTVPEDGNHVTYAIKDSYWGAKYNVSAQKLQLQKPHLPLKRKQTSGPNKRVTTGDRLKPL
jgi:hypothetical protein